jgi:AmmeMemoRadiSam system protein A
MDDITRCTLLDLARETIRARLGEQPLPSVPPTPPLEAGGVFVTLRNGPRLRGCIGQFRIEQNLAHTVQQVALAVLSDPRFTRVPVTLQEVPQLTVEISVLSPSQRVADASAVIPGVHGVIIRRQGRLGCFLPQVAPEMGWGRDEFLSRCCADKAGLEPDAWMDPETEINVFTAEHFEQPPCR